MDTVSKTIDDMIRKIKEEKEVEFIELNNTITKLNKTITKLKNTNGKLKASKEILEFKISFYLDFLRNNTNFKISDIIKEKEDGIHLYNHGGGNIPVFLHNYVNDNQELKEYSIKVKKCEQEKKEVFRTIIEKEKLIIENPKKEEEHIKKVEEKINEIFVENFDVSKKDIICNIEKIVDDIKNCRATKKSYFSSIKENRCKLLGKINLQDYTTTIKTDINKLNTILTEKKIMEKKIISNITNSLSPLEQRLIFYDKYYDTTLEVEEIQRLKLALQINMSYDKRYVPFLYSYLTDKIYNYGVAIFSIKEILEIVLVNPFKFSNIIYLNVGKDTDKEDPYTFYILESIKEDGKRNWKMNNRLTDFSRQLSDIIKTYCVDLFKKMYFNVFSDNIYREEYKEKAVIFQQDCEQLLQNLIFISNQKSFTNFIRDLICKNHCIESSILDKFDFKSDDTTARRTFHKEKDEEQDIVECFKLLFDSINEDEIKNLIGKLIGI
jgi:hypothetical protein